MCKYCERGECDTDCAFADTYTGTTRPTAAQWRERGRVDLAARVAELESKLGSEVLLAADLDYRLDASRDEVEKLEAEAARTRLTTDEVNALVYVQCFMTELHLERSDLPPELGAIAQAGLTVVEKLIEAARDASKELG